MKENCFAYSLNYKNRCRALLKANCNNCKFYKPLYLYKEQLKKLYK